MTPPLFIGSQVHVIGPNCEGKCEPQCDFEITHISKDVNGKISYSAFMVPWYPASSLRLVEDELKIGDWVEVIGPDIIGAELHKIGRIFEITQMPDRCKYLGPTDDKDCYSTEGIPMYPVTSLRKLTSEEIAMHTGYKMQEFQVATAKGMAAISRLLAPIVEKHVADAIKKLSDIERRMDSIGPSHAELLGDVEALAEKVGAIENQLKLFSNSVNSRLDVLEGEKPEVCEGKEQISDELIRIIIIKGDRMEANAYYYPSAALAWSKKVLDGMREA